VNKLSGLTAGKPGSAYLTHRVVNQQIHQRHLVAQQAQVLRNYINRQRETIRIDERCLAECEEGQVLVHEQLSACTNDSTE
jgi:predicted transcriptional regulator